MRRILPILLFLGLIAFRSNGQESRLPDPANKIVVKTYPNPATSYIVFDLQRNYQKGLTIIVYNFLGKKMYETQNIPERTTLNLNDFNRGVYIYHLTDPTGRLIDTGKFQVSR